MKITGMFSVSRGMHVRFMLALMCLFVGLSGRGQAVASPDNIELLMGNLAPVTVSVPVSSDSSKVELPALGRAILEKKKFFAVAGDSVEVLTRHTVSFDSVSGRPQKKFHFFVQAFDSGTFVLPPFDLIVDGKPEKTNPVTLTVLPVKVKADDKIDDFSDIADPFEVNPDPEEMEEDAAGVLVWWLIAAAVLLLIAITWLFVRFRKTGRILPMSKPVPPYKQALSRLKKLQHQNLPAKGKTKEFYTRLTDIIRVYLNAQFDIRTIEHTSAEILDEVAIDRRLEKYEEVLQPIFETADFVKFAKVNPDADLNDRNLEATRSFIIDSAPKEEPAKKATQGESQRKGGEK